MKVSIIGAGLSGLACAHRLVQLGVTPGVFEKDEKVGAFYPVAEALLEMLYRPVEGPLRRLKPMKRAYRRSLGMRRLFVGLEDSGLDRLVRMLGTPLGQRLLIKSRLNLIQLAGAISSLHPRHLGKRFPFGRQVRAALPEVSRRRPHVKEALPVDPAVVAEAVQRRRV